jgi:hypothetical protein
LAAATPLPAAATDSLRAAIGAFLFGFAIENTRRSYAADLKAWLAHCVDHEVAPLAARRAHIDPWAHSLEAGLSPAWPGESNNATGCTPPSTTAWIFVVSPPRELSSRGDVEVARQERAAQKW